LPSDHLTNGQNTEEERYWIDKRHIDKRLRLPNQAESSALSNRKEEDEIGWVILPITANQFDSIEGG
jgi:hypothetical protein